MNYRTANRIEASRGDSGILLRTRDAGWVELRSTGLAVEWTLESIVDAVKFKQYTTTGPASVSRMYCPCGVRVRYKVRGACPDQSLVDPLTGRATTCLPGQEIRELAAMFRGDQAPNQLEQVPVSVEWSSTSASKHDDDLAPDSSRVLGYPPGSTNYARFVHNGGSLQIIIYSPAGDTEYDRFTAVAPQTDIRVSPDCLLQIKNTDAINPAKVLITYATR